MSVQNWHEKFDEFWPEHSKISKICTLMGCFWPKYIMFEPKKYRGIMFDGTEDWCKMTWGIWQILERKMAELNQSKNSKQPGQPDAVWKLYFSLEINE